MTGEQLFVAYAIIGFAIGCWLFVLLIEAADRGETKRENVVMAMLALVWPLLVLGLVLVALIVAVKRAYCVIKQA